MLNHGKVSKYYFSFAPSFSKIKGYYAQSCIQNPVKHLRMELFTEIVNGLILLAIFAKNLILHVWEGSEHAFEALPYYPGIRLPEGLKYNQNLKMKYEAINYSSDFTVKYLRQSHISFITFSGCSKFHLSIIFGSVVMTNLVCEGFVPNPNVPVVATVKSLLWFFLLFDDEIID